MLLVPCPPSTTLLFDLTTLFFLVDPTAFDSPGNGGLLARFFLYQGATQQRGEAHHRFFAIGRLTSMTLGHDLQLTLLIDPCRQARQNAPLLER